MLVLAQSVAPHGPVRLKSPVIGKFYLQRPGTGQVSGNPVSKGIRRILVYSPFTRPQPWTMAVQSRACAHTQAVASSVCVMDDDVALHAIYRCIFVHDLDLGLKQNLIGAKLI